MPQSTLQERKIHVSTRGGTQTVRIPDEFRFATPELFIRRDAASGDVTLSERPLAEKPRSKKSLEEIFAAFDALDLSDFNIERDLDPPPDRDLF